MDHTKNAAGFLKSANDELRDALEIMQHETPLTNEQRAELKRSVAMVHASLDEMKTKLGLE